jgi:protein-S-isoprenylcysteine O-methyltransferase Ste14
VRAAVWATLFVSALLVYLPAQLLAGAGIRRPPTFGLLQLLGGLLTTAGGALAVWCIVTFAFVGRGTPAPFDPPRRLVQSGPYRFVRNPMYVGATFALCGGALVYESAALLAYAAGFALVMHVFVVSYEEPTLARTFGDDYTSYRRRVARWWPRA